MTARAIAAAAPIAVGARGGPRIEPMEPCAASKDSRVE